MVSVRRAPCAVCRRRSVGRSTEAGTNGGTRHLENYTAAELPLGVREPDKVGGAGRGWRLADHVIQNLSLN